MLMRAAALVALGLVVMPASAQQRSYDPNFRPAQEAFNALQTDTRLWLQLFLTSAGHWPAVPNVTYSRRLYGAVQELQRSRGEEPTGVMTKPQIDQMLASASSVLSGWRMRWVPHPTRGRQLWVPIGLDLQATRTELGVDFREPRNRFRLKFNAIPAATVRATYEATLREMVASGDTINFKVLRSDFFVITGNQGRYSRYVRYHTDGDGILGFDMSWSDDDAPVYGKRLVTVISGSLWATMTGAPFPTTQRGGYPWERPTEPEVASQQRPAAPPPAPTAQEPTKVRFSTGSGFFVSKAGHILTNAHVVTDCSTITARSDGSIAVIAQMLARDAANDLAVLKVAGPVERSLSIRPSIRLGEGIAAFGFPHSDLLATTGNFTLGNVTALAGLKDDSRYLQVSAPVQAGNSGGPLVDSSGNVVGVVTAKLDAIRMAAAQGDLPQNVNFAVKASVATSFLDANQITYDAATPGEKLDPADLAERAKKASVFITCR